MSKKRPVIDAIMRGVYFKNDPLDLDKGKYENRLQLLKVPRLTKDRILRVATEHIIIAYLSYSEVLNNAIDYIKIIDLDFLATGYTIYFYNVNESTFADVKISYVKPDIEESIGETIEEYDNLIADAIFTKSVNPYSKFRIDITAPEVGANLSYKIFFFFKTIKYTDSEVEAIITAELVNGQSIDNAIDSLILTHKNLVNAHHNKPSDLAYSGAWNTNLDPATKNAIYNAVNYSLTHIFEYGVYTGNGGANRLIGGSLWVIVWLIIVDTTATGWTTFLKVPGIPLKNSKAFFNDTWYTPTIELYNSNTQFRVSGIANTLNHTYEYIRFIQPA